MKLEILKEFRKAAKALEGKPLSKRYFEEESKILQKRNNESERIRKATTISFEKLHTPFNI